MYLDLVCVIFRWLMRYKGEARRVRLLSKYWCNKVDEWCSRRELEHIHDYPLRLVRVWPRAELIWRLSTPDYILSSAALDVLHQYVDWNIVCAYQSLDCAVVAKYLNNVGAIYSHQYSSLHPLINPRSVFTHYLPLKLLECLKCIKGIDIKTICSSHPTDADDQLSENRVRSSTICDHDDFILSHKIKHHTFSEDFLEKIISCVTPYRISRYQKLSEDFIRRHITWVDWRAVTRYQPISEEFIEEMEDRIHWNHVGFARGFSYEFLRRNLGRMNISMHFSNVAYSEKKLRKLAPVLTARVGAWRVVSYTQILSEEFLREFKDDLDLTELLVNIRLSNAVVIRVYAEPSPVLGNMLTQIDRMSYQQQLDHSLLADHRLLPPDPP